MHLIHTWQRLEGAGLPVYVQPARPDWLVPDAPTDLLLQQLQAGGTAADLLARERLLGQLDPAPAAPYMGRGASLQLAGLKECWFHLTDNCNLACRHCLFAASPAATRTLPAADLRKGLAEARALGCTLFYFTGGEPFVYPDFTGILADLLQDEAVHAVVLTNGMLLREHLEALRKLPADRLHLQISMDGLAENHERLRGTGTFPRLLANLAAIQSAGFKATLSVAVNRGNVDELPAIVAFAAEQGVGNIHLLWHFVRGKGDAEQFVAPTLILPHLVAAQQAAEASGVVIDNVETLRGQVFSTPGTRFDLSNTGWESLAVGPDGMIYPSPALVGLEALNCGPLADGLETVWRHSPVLEKIRAASLIDVPSSRENPLAFLIGGGDIDHSYLAGGEFVGHDPYLELYNGLALWLIGEQARRYPDRQTGDILLRMGDVRHDCPASGEVALTHCNCVISLADDRGHSSVRAFYGAAAVCANEEIANPFAPAQAAADYIPAEVKKKSYGCGSPVSDAALRPGEVLVDLGSGSGIECFMAAAAVGKAGKVYGIDMTDEMLHLARGAKAEVTAKLGYDNIEFRKGFLEAIPLADNSADAVISNCVINLSPDKRQTFHEIFRILKPGGRLVVSDIVTDGSIPVRIKNDEKFRGECLGGALQQEQLLAMLRAAGFGGLSLVKRFPYRHEGGVTFYSLTFRGYKPATAQEVEVIYRGPFAAVTTESGVLLPRGRRVRIALAEATALDDSVFVVDAAGAVVNMAFSNSCCASPPQASLQPMTALAPPAAPAGGCGCGDAAQAAPPETKIIPLATATPPPAAPAKKADNGRHQAGCMVCGGEIAYLAQGERVQCYYCGGNHQANAVCAEGHYVCDDCHQEDGLSVIRLICAETGETDMLALLQKIRRHPAIPMHGPEHHAMVPGTILATYRNLGGAISREAILTGIERGSKVPGGVCGFWGNCGAAAGVGIAYSVILAATPLTAGSRQQAQAVTARVLERIAAVKGGRCCQRETVTALREAAAISAELLPVTLRAEAEFACGQFGGNKECIRRQCPLWGAAEKGATALGERS